MRYNHQRGRERNTVSRYVPSATDDPAVTHTEPSYATPAGMM
jgi:hypothetical protein